MLPFFPVLTKEQLFAQLNRSRDWMNRQLLKEIDGGKYPRCPRARFGDTELFEVTSFQEWVRKIALESDSTDTPTDAPSD